MTAKNVDGRTKRAAEMALAKRLISRSSYDAILRGELSLAEAKELGRDRGPHDTARASGGREGATERSPEGRERPQEGTTIPPRLTSRISKDDATQECWCGCGERTKPHRKWKPGHDQRAKGIIKRAVTAGKADELSDRLRDYGQERGLI